LSFDNVTTAERHFVPRRGAREANDARRSMTKFEPLAKGERGRDRARPSAAERRSRMETFKRTGAHPELEIDPDDARRAKRLANVARKNASNVKAFVDVEVAGENRGSVVIEVLEEAAPRAARRFAERLEATEGDRDGVSYRDSCEMTTVDDELRVSFGVSGKRVKTTIEVEGELTHAAAGVVGVDRRSGEFCVTTAACESLDESAQVVGRVISGLEILRALTHREKVEKVPTPVRVTACGVVRGGADVSALVGVAARGRAEAAAKARAEAEKIRNESQHDTLKRLRAESAQKGAEMNEIVRSTLGKKLKEAPKKKPGAGMLDSMLGSSSSDSED
jgi:cyclophilin family peptidyl-prolyl cis-trans isomerase